MSSISKSTINSTTSSTDNGVLDQLRRGPWTLQEDSLLIHYIDRHGEGRWNLLAKHSGLRRTGKSCRLRWLNYLKPDVKRGNLSSQEQLLILELHSKWGNRWSKIAQHLPGRTDNEIKNFWRTRVQKHARHLKINTNSTEFQDFIRSFWMPRLLQNIQASSCHTFSTINPNPFDHNSQQCSLPPPSQESTSKIIGTVTNIIHGQDMQNSDSEHCVGSCISSSESMNISQTSQFSEGCYYVDNGSYFDEFPVGDVCHMEENDWVVNGDSDAYNYMWNLDELWQFRNLQEREF